MHALACLNDRITNVSEISLAGVSPAAFYGRGVFTTVAIYHAEPRQWAEHWRRLTGNAQKIGVDLSEFAEEKVKNSLAQLVGRNRVRAGRARLTFFSRSERNGIWQIENPLLRRQTDLLITSADFRPAPPAAAGLRLTVSPYRVNSRSPLAGVKSCNYLENLLALEKARAGGYGEAIRLNERNEIVSAATANLFWVKHGEIYTPPVETGALEGTTRDFILKNFRVSEKLAGIDELLAADEIFLSSAGIGVAGASGFDQRSFKDSEVCAGVRRSYEDLTLGL